MNPEADRLEAARNSGEQYGTRAAELCLILLSTAPGEEVIEEQIKNLARNIREQAGRYAKDLGEELAPVWKEAALKAAQARLHAADPENEAG
jgi:hypothetical protein